MNSQYATIVKNKTVRCRSTVVVAAVALALVGSGRLWATVRAQSRTIPAEEIWPDPTVPVAHLRPGGPASAFMIRFYLSVKERNVQVRTTYTPAPTASVPHPTALAWIESDYDLRYWPTAATRLDDSRIVLTGKSSAGLTIIETWTFEPPALSADGAQIVAPRRSSVVRHYEAYAPGRDTIQATALDLTGTASRVLVQFYDSRDLLSFDLASRTLTAVASPHVGSGVFHAPQLDDYQWSAFEAKTHVVQGNVYLFRPKRHVVVAAGPGQDVVAIALIDSNKDGIIDSATSMTTSEWQSAGYANPTNWVR